MTKLKMYQVDAFAQKLFQGNPAAIIVTDEELPAEMMQAIANENNLSETAFVHGQVKDRYSIRWFTPKSEVDLCGHATLAAAHILMTEYGASEELGFSCKTGELRVYQDENMLWLNFPADELDDCDAETTQQVQSALGLETLTVVRGRSDLMAVVKTHHDVTGASPVMHRVSKLKCRGLILTSIGKEDDFISRFFAPQVGVPEDPVTGSAHTTLTPYWATELKKNELKARQVSPRGGQLICKLISDRVHIGGQAITFMEADLRTNSPSGSGINQYKN